MNLRRQMILGGISFPFISLANTPNAQIWPNKPVKIVIPYPAGGVTDVIGRTILERITKHIPGGSFIIENRPGGSTQIGVEAVSNSAPDGYTFLLTLTQSFSILPHIRKLPYSLENNFEIINGVAEYAGFVIVRSGLNVTTLGEFLDLARKNPGKITYGSAGIGSFAHIYGEQLKKYAGIDMLHVPYKGSAELTTAVLAGEIDMFIVPTDSNILRSGRATVLACFANKRHPELPNIPTIGEAGIKVDLPWNGWGFFAPKGTPSEIIDTFNLAIEKIMQENEVIERFSKSLTFPKFISSNQMKRHIQSSSTFYKSLLNNLEIKN